MSHAWSYGESSLDKWPSIDSNKEAYPGTIPMIKYWGEGEYDLFEFDFEVGDERPWGVVWRRIFLALQTLPDMFSKLHHQLGLFASFLKICMVLDMFQIELYLLWHESFGGLDHLTELRDGRSKGVYWILGKLRHWELSKLNIGSCHWWWMMDDRWWIEHGRVGCDKAVGDGKSKRCLTLAESELDTCWDWHPCLSSCRSPTTTSYSSQSLVWYPTSHRRTLWWHLDDLLIIFGKSSRYRPTVILTDAQWHT